MSTFQTMVNRLNALLHPDNLENLDPARVAPGIPLSDPLRQREIARTDRELEYFMSWPESLREAIRSVVYSALSRSPRIPVTFAWAPGYDYEMTVWEAPGSRESAGGITILLRSRYPNDTHPSLR